MNVLFTILITILVLNADSIKEIPFIGECRVCQGLEAVMGHWLMQRQSKNCSDREISYKFASDVLKKSNFRNYNKSILYNSVNLIYYINIVSFFG